MKASKILDFLFGYEEADRNFKSSKLSGLGKSFTDNMVGGIGSAYAKKILKNPVSDFFSRLARDLAADRIPHCRLYFLPCYAGLGCALDRHFADSSHVLDGRRH